MPDFTFSIFSQLSETGADDSRLVAVVEGALQSSGETSRWRSGVEGIWCGLTPSGYVQRRQGWKLHVSATVSSAERVLDRTLPVLLKSASAFKFASTLEHVA
ncbi:MAG: pknA1, partial [Pseudonocardia sp.]|nr:pknA1 [Pseudonocardia sp.]